MGKVSLERSLAWRKEKDKHFIITCNLTKIEDLCLTVFIQWERGQPWKKKTIMAHFTGYALIESGDYFI